MNLHFKKTGEGKPLIILHGLFGSGDNWATLARGFADKDFSCYLVDQRNHGRSNHSDEFNYDVMAEDLAELINAENISTASLIGHSMGGKTAMFFAMNYPEKVDKLIIADIAPRFYPQHHQSIFSAINSIDLENITTRKEAEEKLREALRGEATIQFLLKNLYWKEESRLDWRFGISEIEKNIEEVGKPLPDTATINVPTLFLRGDRSGYIDQEDEEQIRKIFPQSDIKTISNAGHWIHAENPKEFAEVVLAFLSEE